jgi:hypothetical protein
MALAAIPFRLTAVGPDAFVPNHLSQAPCQLDVTVFARFCWVFTLFKAPVPGGRVCRTGRSCPSVWVPLPQAAGKKPSEIAAPNPARRLRWVLADQYRIAIRASVSDFPDHSRPHAGGAEAGQQ